jgi:hypothetical protein
MILLVGTTPKVAIGSSMDLLVVSLGSDQVLRYDGITGDFVEVFATGMYEPKDLVIGPDNNLYVSDQGNDTVVRFDGTTGEFIDVFASDSGLDGPGGLEFGPDGNLYVSSSNTRKVLRFHGTTGEFIDVFAYSPYLENNWDLTFGPDKNLYVSNTHKHQVMRFDGITGEFIDVFASGGNLVFPTFLTFGRDGSLYVSSEDVLRFDGTTGAFIDVFASTGAYGIDFGPDGNLYVSNASRREILRYDGITGEFIDVFASGGGLAGPRGLLFAALQGSAPEPECANITLSPDFSASPVWTTHTVSATSIDNYGNPSEGCRVKFEILSGPNAGRIWLIRTDKNGTATFTYMGSGGAGTDIIKASIVDSQGNIQLANIVEKEWEESICQLPADDITHGDVEGLIAAINAANACLQGATINLAPKGTYILTEVENFADGENGLPSITSQIIINGNGSTIKRGGSNSFRIFHVSGGLGNLTLNDLTISNGYSGRGGGGGIFNIGTLILNNSIVSENSTGPDYYESYNGGGVFNTGTLHLINSIIIGNKAGDGIGGLCDESTGCSGSDGSHGGGIYNTGILTLTNSTISSNAAGSGGGSSCYKCGWNPVDGDGGSGGGIYNAGKFSLTSSTISGNRAGGGANGGAGGGICSTGPMTLTNSTISGNRTDYGGGDGIDGSGGGIYSGGQAILTNSTIWGNRSTYGYHETSPYGEGGGIYSAGTLELTNTIVANNPKGGDCVGEILSKGYNIDSDRSCNLVESTDLPGLDLITQIRLGPLADYGGATETHALLADSLAIDAGENGICSQTDQRGVFRPFDGDFDGTAICDIGAVEFYQYARVVSPGAGIIITTLTPTFEWSAFQDAGDGDLQAGYQIQVICDNRTVYDTGFIPDLTGHTHTYKPPGTYRGYDSVADTARISEPLEYGQQCQWRVRYLDSGRDWWDWSSVEPRQDFYVYTISTGDLFVPYQKITTNGATDWESFTIENDTYLAVANHGAWDPYRQHDSVIYRWNGSVFTEFQRIETFGAHDFEAFTIDDDIFLAVANFYHVGYDVVSMIYKWNGSHFEEFQSILTGGGNEWKSFIIGTDIFLAVSNYGSGSIIYRWNGSAFVQYQEIATKYAQGVEIFTIGSDIFLAVAGLDSNSVIYKWDGCGFVEFQEMYTNGALDWKTMVIGEDTFLAVANYYGNESILYKWDGSSFIEYQVFTTYAAYDWESFVIDQYIYLAVANRNDDSVIYRWNGSKFVPAQSLATTGAVDIELFSIGPDPFLAVANHHDVDKDAYILESLVFRLNSAPIYKGDFNKDGAITYDDFYDIFLPAYGTREGDHEFVPDCDLNADGIIDMLDYAQWYNLYMNDHPASLSVTIEPLSASDEGAAWRLASEPETDTMWHYSGDKIKNLTTGPYRVIFKDIDGWRTPVDQAVELTEGPTKSLSGVYKLYPETAMISYWKLDAGSGKVAKDYVNDNNGTILGATWTDGKVGYALNFDGDNEEYVNIPDSENLDISGDEITVSAWILTTRLDERQVIAGKTACGDNTWLVEINPLDCAPGQLYFYLAHGGDICSNSVLDVNTWHHVAFVYDGEAGKIYIDGRLDASQPLTGNIPTNNQPVRIGAWGTLYGCGGTPNRFFYGKIDEVAVYQIALTQEEIQKQYINGLNGLGYE